MAPETHNICSNQIPEPLSPYFEAKKNGTLCQYYLGSFQHRRDDYLDDLPSMDISTLTTLDENGLFVGNNYKCQGNYIFSLSLELQCAVKDGVISDSGLVSKINQFIHQDFAYVHGKFTIPEEINMMNMILTDVIQYLEIIKE